MAVHVIIDSKARLVRSTFSGYVTLVDFLEGRMKVVEHPDRTPRFVHVIDLTAVTNVDVPDETLRLLVAMRPLFDPDTLQIVVLTPGSPMSHFVETFKRLAGSGRNIQIVPSLDEANALAARQ